MWGWQNISKKAQLGNKCKECGGRTAYETQWLNFSGDTENKDIYDWSQVLWLWPNKEMQ